MCEDAMIKLKGIAAIIEYMSSAEKLDVNYTKEALSVLTKEMYEILEGIEK